jgi:telomere length regulation protein
MKIEGGGGEDADRIRKASAAIVIKMDELTSKWRRSMILS